MYMYFCCICGQEGDLHVLPSAILKVSPLLSFNNPIFIYTKTAILFKI